MRARPGEGFPRPGPRSPLRFGRPCTQAPPSGRDSPAVGEEDGHALYLAGGVSWNCPALGLWGYGTEKQLRNAVRRQKARPR